VLTRNFGIQICRFSIMELELWNWTPKLWIRTPKETDLDDLIWIIQCSKSTIFRHPIKKHRKTSKKDVKRSKNEQKTIQMDEKTIYFRGF
jgi:hypothetical protein